MRILTATLLVCAFAAAQTKESEKLAPFFPTPPSIAEQMLKLGQLQKGEKMFDLGSGDGRIVIMAAEKFGAEATGVELDESLYKQSSAEIKRRGLKNARIIHGDVLKQDYSSADLLTVYLLPDSINDKVRPILEKQLKKGARIVSHDFEFAGWKPEKTEHIEDDGEGRSHTIYLYRR